MQQTNGQKIILGELFPGKRCNIICASENGYDDEGGKYRGKWIVKVDDICYIMKDDAILETIKHFSK